MENTLENKAKFRALYYRQNVLVGGVRLTTDMIVDKENHWPLEINSLSNITDEDATEIIAILYPKDKLIIEKLSRNRIGVKIDIKLTLSQRWLMPKNKQSVIVYNNCSFNNDFPNHIYLKIADYLRSKGYALPFMGVSVEKQIEYGWIKITPNV